jgi:hypothetical protein
MDYLTRYQAAPSPPFSLAIISIPPPHPTTPAIAAISSFLSSSPRSVRRLEAKLDRIAEAARLASHGPARGGAKPEPKSAAAQPALDWRGSTSDRRWEAAADQARGKTGPTDRDSRGAASTDPPRGAGRTDTGVGGGGGSSSDGAWEGRRGSSLGGLGSADGEPAAGGALGAAWGGAGAEPLGRSLSSVGQEGRGAARAAACCLCEGRLGEMMMQLDRVAGALAVGSSTKARDDQVVVPDRIYTENRARRKLGKTFGRWEVHMDAASYLSSSVADRLARCAQRSNPS